jgi:hypothetical protein
MKRITTRLFPYAGDVLLSDNDATRSYREAFYYALATEAGEDLRLLVDSCRPALSQIDRRHLAVAPKASWLDIMVPARPHVEAWARDRNLNVDWLIEDILLALALLDGGLLFLAAESRLSENKPPPPPIVPISVSIENWWHYSTVPRWAMREFLIDSLTGEVDAELDRIEQGLAAAGVVRREGKRARKSRGGADPSRHFRWLVRYQVRKERYTDIGNSEGATRDAVMNGVRDAKDRIGIDLRDPDPPGAPPGPRKSPR